MQRRVLRFWYLDELNPYTPDPKQVCGLGVVIQLYCSGCYHCGLRLDMFASIC